MRSFEVRTQSVARVANAVLRECLSEPVTGLLLLAGSLATQAEELASALAKRAPKSSWLVVPTSGVLSEAGELESESAAVGICLASDRADIVLCAKPSEEFGEALRGQLTSSLGATSLVFLRADAQEEAWLPALTAGGAALEASIFGGGTLPRLDLWLSRDPQSRVGSRSGPSHRRGAAAALVIKRPLLGRLISSAACRLISPLHTVTKTRGSLLLELDHLPALDLLGVSTDEHEEPALILLAVGAQSGALSPEGRNLALRSVVGVDPAQHGILLGDELPVGSQVAFAVRDSHGARQDLEAHLGSLRRNCCGAAPTFGLYVSCAGRGKALYQAPDVDIRMIKNHFPGMPFVGFHSTFELAPLDGRLTPQVYSGVLSVFCSPS